MLNSRLGLFAATTFVAPLLPKLRGNFAEFLNNPSPVGLRILIPSTCVGLRYGHLIYTNNLFSPVRSSTSLLISVPYAGGTISPDRLVTGVSYLKYFDGYGISTVCASVTPCGLALAPAYLGRTNLPQETLDFRPLRFSRNSRYSFRHSHFCTVHRCFRYDFTPYRTLPYPVFLLPTLRLYA